MAQTQYLKRLPSGVYVVRMYVPRQLQPVLGKKELHASTRCRDLPLAKVVASSLVADWHRRLAGLLSMDPSKVLSGSLDLLRDGLIALDQAAAQLGSDRQRLAEHLLQRRVPFLVHLVDQQGWLIQDIELLNHDHDETGLAAVDLSDMELERHGVARRLSADVALRFPDEVRSLVRGGSLMVCQFMLPPIAQMGFIVPLPGLELTADLLMVRARDVEELRKSLLPDAKAQVQQLAQFQAPAPVEPVPTISSYCEPKHAKTPLAELVRKHIDAGRASWKPDTLQTKEGVATVLLDLVGDLTLGQLDRDVLWDVARQAATLPHRRDLVKRRFNAPDASTRQLIALAEEHQLERLSPRALQSLVDDIGEFLKWGERQGYLTRNPAAGLADDVFKMAGGKQVAEADQRAPLSTEDLEKIFNAEWFRHGAGKATKSGSFHFYRPHYYWLPLLGLYAGGRINELSQLYLDDIVEVPDGTAYLDFNLQGEGKLDLDAGDGHDPRSDRAGADDKSLKNTNAMRIVPLHPRLVELGLLDYARALREAGHQRLFPELAWDKVKGYGKAPSSWFNERFMGRELGIVRDGKKTFHSLRHNFATALGDAEVPSVIKSQLLGHSRGSSTTEKRYDKGRTSQQLAPHLAKISYELPQVAAFQVDAGVRAVADALRLKTRRLPRSARTA